MTYPEALQNAHNFLIDFRDNLKGNNVSDLNFSTQQDGFHFTFIACKDFSGGNILINKRESEGRTHLDYTSSLEEHNDLFEAATISLNKLCKQLKIKYLNITLKEKI